MESGHGVPNIISKYGKDCFKITDNYVLVTLPYDKEVLNKIGNVRLNATQQAIIELLKTNPKLNAQDIADELKKSKKTIERSFIKL